MFRFFRTKVLILTISFISVLFSVACAENGADVLKSRPTAFSVNFLSVGQGDCALIVFPDGKTLMIDCGESNEINFNTVCAFLDAAGGKAIDYLILSHVDSDHTGNAAAIIRKYGVKTAYIPKVEDESKYTAYKNAKAELTACGATIKISAAGERIMGEDYFACFLYPSEDDGYDDMNFGDGTAQEINATSSVVYLDYAGVRFLFTGDATAKAEEKVVNRAKDGLYYLYGGGGFRINLRDVDFLKVSHHGGKEEISDKFYEYLKPENAVISVGALNNYGHPSIYTLVALTAFNPDINILRTDVLGSISVDIGSGGTYRIITDADGNAN